MILAGATEQNAVGWAELARGRLAQTPFRLGDQIITMTASFGAAQRTASTNSIEELIDAADQALIVAKTSGRNRVIAASDFQSLSELVDPSIGPLPTNGPTPHRQSLTPQ